MCSELFFHIERYGEGMLIQCLSAYLVITFCLEYLFKNVFYSILLILSAPLPTIGLSGKGNPCEHKTYNICCVIGNEVICL